MRLFLPLCVVVLVGCPAPVVEPDAGAPVDAGGEPVACDSNDDCTAVGGACRAQVCEADVPCRDDLECGLGERCVGGQCRFRGCVADADCATGHCDARTFSCAECGADRDCPRERPVCDTSILQCVRCRDDADCHPPGPAHCTADGTCVACLEDAHCPNGLTCEVGDVCAGVAENAPCPEGTACGPGLACVTVNNNPICLRSCTLYEPQCPTGLICFSLSYSSTTSYVFEAMGPIGVCFTPQPGYRGLREPCVRTPTGSNCQPNLQCVPETASLSLCRQYCNPLASGTCPVGERCQAFVGDYSGREYGLCLPDNGFGPRCDGDRDCRAGLSCQPYDVPSDSDEVGSVCQFNVGDGGALAPCRDEALADGGVQPGARACRSGLCTRDPLAFSSAVGDYFCFGACADDGDCGDAGVCDAEFSVSTAYDTFGYVRGCRATCQEEADCALYDAGVTCRVRQLISTTSPAFTTTCSPPPSSGVGPAGAPCTFNGQCRSNLCLLDDTRGVRHAGVCATPCRDSATCAVEFDGGALVPLDCLPSAALVNRGLDYVSNTADDVFVARNLCTGVACAEDDDCRPDGGFAVCALEVAPPPASGAVQRCRPPTAGALRGGEACTADLQCASGACGRLPTDAGSCFEACTGATVCPTGMSCRPGGLSVTVRGASLSVDSCAP